MKYYIEIQLNFGKYHVNTVFGLICKQSLSFPVTGECANFHKRISYNS